MARSTTWRAAKPATRAFLRESRELPGHGLFDRLHGYIYLRWPYLYISAGTGEHWLSRPLAAAWRALGFTARRSRGGTPAERRLAFADGYHGKVVRLDEARQLVTLNEEISLQCPEQVIPYPRARDLIMQNPEHIVALDCPCRTVRANPCKPLDVCLVIGEPFASFIVEHLPGHARWITQERAEEILREESERGHVHHAFFKDAMLERFYAICNCCSCCCGALQAYEHGTPMLASSGYVSHVDPESCTACETCVDNCQFHAISIVDGNGSAEGWAVVDEEACMGCGVCEIHCEWDAAALVRDPRKGEPLEIRSLIGRP